MKLHVQPSAQRPLPPLDLTQSPSWARITVRSFTAGRVGGSVAQRMVSAAKQRLSRVRGPAQQALYHRHGLGRLLSRRGDVCGVLVSQCAVLGLSQQDVCRAATRGGADVMASHGPCLANQGPGVLDTGHRLICLVNAHRQSLQLVAMSRPLSLNNIFNLKKYLPG